MEINFDKAKRVAVSCLAMTSCGFLLWINQLNASADENQSSNLEVTQNKVQQPKQQANSNNINQSSQTKDSYDYNDHGNYAYLDSEQLTDNGQLNVSGWHVTNASQNRPYHYLIAYDSTNHQEISRQNITDQEVSRPDVQKAHNVYDAKNSGFKASFNLSSQLANLKTVQVISRYTNDQFGNGDAVDYWFAPITIDQNNYANLDNASVVNNKLRLSGWNATNQASNKSYHYVILIDRTNGGREITRQLVKNVDRPDVAKVYSGVDNAQKSGFVAELPLNNINFSHQLQVISRYSGSKDGNSDYVDYWFNPITTGNYANQGNLDDFDLSNGKQVVISGWHANDVANFENNHFIILYDNTANQQVAVQNVKQVSRPDVAKAYPSINQAGNSGFSTTLNLENHNLVGGHSYSVVSRYSTSSNENGGSGQYTDYWSSPVVLNSHAFYLDDIKMQKDGLHVTGWVVSDYSSTRKNPYIFVLNNGREVARQKLSLNRRADVARVYPKVFNSVNSGFNTVVKLNPALVSGNMQVLLRFSADPAGNVDNDDQYSDNYQSNAGNFDRIDVSQGGMYVSGWHASNQTLDKPYQYLIFIDQNGHELYRQSVPDANRSRSDVAKAYPAIFNSEKSGYQLGFNLPESLQHKIVKVIHRYSNDPRGNGNYVDYVSGPVNVNLMRTPIDYRQPSEYVPYPNVSKLHNFWIHVRIGQNRVYLMDGNNIVYTMYCSAGVYQNGISETPTGTYYIQPERGNSFYNGSEGEGANYWTSFLNHGEYLFHSVPTDYRGNYIPGETAKLGVSTGSHGCVRLSVPDAYWILHNVPTGTRVVIEN
ncbi:L,D-transpeptidase [Limosilactobacillus fastidiosus]|uniref:L,D-transpeptidase n=1 Tax=Limosilactobacillus fastidiosus TaxID=2759855 RepID=A0ABR6E605_9LACO|nr:L,D-transpeptidase [Limosilactobacillus fastidiosus]MBB1062617.1 L,D-transpeptidase [Limosilactobacillus fastidiosus]MCD7083981.1 L,D-transpeptidase [Limosilactobacillus fastidiosus]